MIKTHSKKRSFLFFSLLIALLLLSGCRAARTQASGKKVIVVTYPVLGAVVRELVGAAADVVVPMPNGRDPHEWEPSAQDVETLTHASLIVQNGLGLEGGMQKALDQAKEQGVKFFSASDHIPVRHVGPGEGLPNGDPDQNIGAPDPHLWLDPLTMKTVVIELSEHIKTDLGIDLSERSTNLQARLDSLNSDITLAVSQVPPESRKLVTGHESLGYFAQRYGFKLIGAVTPGLSSQGEVSAADLAALKKVVLDNQVKAIFTEIGTPAAVTQAIGQETGVKIIPLATHILPDDGSYFTFMNQLTNAIVEGLK